MTISHAHTPPHQLSLLPALTAGDAQHVTPPHPSGSFTAPSNASHSMVLLALLNGPAPLEQLHRLAGTDDSTDLLSALRQYGLTLPCHQIPVIGPDGDVGQCLVCGLTPADMRRIKRWLSRLGGKND